MAKITIDKAKCSGNGICVQTCPVSIFELKAGKCSVISSKMNDCLQCMACEASCPEKAIKVVT
ncbi:MAG: 4Fe-4S dicluster domain-containing protein [Candidatus Diapherotrites archaeon]|uniref:4Fe-4S dicluster domain-containing protein n=1 Tax=Candidatus Iainarchaeum sp. TaxID=3101447 RepID=A0A8T4KTD0_9ARCH|nr:4Fe-4S dicluster domain-containing protein [Candidatus Diapherotrites archaeon]